MDRKRDRTTVKHVIHVRRVLKDRMKDCTVTGKTVLFAKLHVKYLEL